MMLSQTRELTEQETELLRRARDAGQTAYCPYSGFQVGAAVETEQGVFVGCNIENASYGLSLCAERVALFGAIAAGAHQIRCLAVSCLKTGQNEPDGTRMPCGACRQVIAEFMSEDSTVIVDGAGIWKVQDLLPAAFQLSVRPFLDRRSS